MKKSTGCSNEKNGRFHSKRNLRLLDVSAAEA